MVNIVAELCCNHQGKPDIAKKMIDECAKCGVNYVKLQKRHIEYCADWDYEYKNANSFGKTYYDHRKALELVDVAWWELKDYAEKSGIGLFATAFDIKSVDFLVDLGVPYIKVGSAQAHNNGFLEYVRNKHVKTIVSTGMSTWKEAQDIVEILEPDVVFHTTTCYPCPEEGVELNVITKYLRTFKCSVGLSGHYSAGNGAIEAAAVALGATWIERHFTLDRTWKGSDHVASLEAPGLSNVVKAVRSVERALGTGKKHIMDCEKPAVEKYR